MSAITIDGVVLFRRDTSANWNYVNPILGDGEGGYDTTINNFKVGNGVTHWADLPYWITSSSLNDIEFDFLAGGSTDLMYSNISIPDVSAKGIFVYAEQYFTDPTYGSTLIPYSLFVQKLFYDNHFLFRKSDPGDNIRITIKR